MQVLLPLGRSLVVVEAKAMVLHVVMDLGIDVLALAIFCLA